MKELLYHTLHLFVTNITIITSNIALNNINRLVF